MTDQQNPAAGIDLNHVVLDYPLYGFSSKSLTRKLAQAATGGLLKSDTNNVPTVRALDGISMSIKAGERVGLYGHNGAGKTSLLRLLAGIVAPTAGTAIVTGRTLPILNISVGTYPDLSGREVIRLRLRLDGYTKREIVALEEEIVDFAELGEFSLLPIRTYSSGMIMRLLFSIVTIQRPDILLMDEWLSVADAQFVHKAEARMHEMMHKAGIVVIASHNLELLKRWCNRVYTMEHGHIIGAQEISHA